MSVESVAAAKRPRAAAAKSSSEPVSLVEKFRNTISAVDSALIERKEEVNIMYLAMICREHACFVGGAGTAKSLMIDEVVGSIGGCSKFDILMSNFTDRVETEGPLDVNELLNGRYLHRNESFMTTAHVVFMDEVFKASSAILNTLLKLINERKYRNDNQWNPSPLISVFGASNEWPVGEDHKEVAVAFFDRFLFRKTIQPISSVAGRNRLRWGDDSDFVAPRDAITLDELKAAQHEARLVPVPKETRNVFSQMMRELNGAGIQPGDRRERKAAQVVKGAAWLDGAAEVMPQHLDILSHVLWTHPDQAPEVKKIIGKHADPDRHAVDDLRSQATEVFAKIDKIFGGAERLTDQTKLGEFITEVGKIEEIAQKAGRLRPTTATTRLREWLAGELETQRLRSVGLKKN